MSAIPRPKRNAELGEIVNLFEGGDPTEVPVAATVQAVHSGGSVTVTYCKPGNISVKTLTSVHHIHSPYWDAVPLSAKQANGAFDFHPVYGPVFDRHLNAVAGAAAARAAREAEMTDLSADEFNAITALETHGDNIDRISKETGISKARLKNLPKFNEALKAVKERNWNEKNGLVKEAEAQAE